MEDLNGFAVEEKFLDISEVRVRRPCAGRRGSLSAGRSAHSLHHILMSINGGAFSCVLDISRHIAARNCCSCGAHLLITACMVPMEMSIDDVPDRSAGDWFRDLFYGGDNLVGHWSGSRVYHQNAVVTHLNGDISDSAYKQVHVALNVERIELRNRRLLSVGCTGRQKYRQQQRTELHFVSFIFC